MVGFVNRQFFPDPSAGDAVGRQVQLGDIVTIDISHAAPFLLPARWYICALSQRLLSVSLALSDWSIHLEASSFILLSTAKLAAIYPHGYWHDENMWPWELYEMLNLAAAVERAAEFDIIHYDAAYYPMSLAFTRLSPTPIVQTLHHSPSAAEVALWARYPEAPFVAISNEQARLLSGLNVVDTVLHGIDTDNFVFRADPDDYLLFLGRFTEGKGVLQAIEIAKRVGMSGPGIYRYFCSLHPRMTGSLTVG